MARDPAGTVREIYDALDMEPGAGGFDAIAAHVDAHPRGGFGGHSYDVGQFGLTEGELREGVRGLRRQVRRRTGAPRRRRIAFQS